MAQKLKVVALISGGKDSLFSILHCIANGHDVVALANLHPDEASKYVDDIDSYMYQTVGHEVIPLYEEALGIPLYRHAIVGKNIEQAQSYLYDGGNISSVTSDAPQDETESLVPLLQKVQHAHPDIEAVSTGAILSTYQRTRVESVAARLDLISLAYLWQYPYLPEAGHSSLLFDMSEVNLDARIIKVASGGLDESYLWMNVADYDVISKLEKAMGRFGDLEVGSVIGEGGEFETLAVDGPKPLWKKRIVVQPTKREVLSGACGTAILRIQEATVVEKDVANTSEVRRPELFEKIFKWILDADAPREDIQKNFCCLYGFYKHVLPSYTEIDTQENIYLFNSTAVSGVSASEQALSICSSLGERLERSSLTPDQIGFTTILLRNMQDFTAVNEVYKQLFKLPEPPARVTIACGDLLPEEALVVISVIANKGNRSKRKGLHVQSQSYWAPANIGPYSQAISTPLTSDEEGTRIVSIAGQIPLEPASMNLHHGTFKAQAVLALQHLWRIGRSMQVHWWTGAVAFITARPGDEARQRAMLATTVWHEAVKNRAQDDIDEDVNFDVGDAKLTRTWMPYVRQQSTHILPTLPDWTYVDARSSITGCSTPCFVAQVDELPRSAPIEWVSTGLALGSGLKKVVCKSHELGYQCLDITSNTSWIFCVSETVDEAESLLTSFNAENPMLELGEAFVSMPTSKKVLQGLQHQRVQVIPCRSLWNGKQGLSLLVRCYSQSLT